MHCGEEEVVGVFYVLLLVGAERVVTWCGGGLILLSFVAMLMCHFVYNMNCCISTCSCLVTPLHVPSDQVWSVSSVVVVVVGMTGRSEYLYLICASGSYLYFNSYTQEQLLYSMSRALRTGRYIQKQDVDTVDTVIRYRSYKELPMLLLSR